MSFLNSLSVAGVGLLVVFVGLAIIIGFISLLSLVKGKDGKQKAEAPKKTAPIPAPAVQAPAKQDGAPADVLAAIIAAISAMMPDGNSFTVRRVKRVNEVPAWSRAGREEQTYGRF